MPISPRRWFAFRLRTLLVVVAVAAIPMGWVGYSLNWIRERHEAIKALKGCGRIATAGPVDEDSPDGIFPDAHQRRSAPAGLWLFGEQGLREIVDFDATPESIEKYRRLFPEATIAPFNAKLSDPRPEP